MICRLFKSRVSYIKQFAIKSRSNSFRKIQKIINQLKYDFFIDHDTFDYILKYRVSLINKQREMCQRNSVQSQECSYLLNEKDEKIKDLLSRIHQLEDQIQARNKQVGDLNQIKKNVRKLPFSIYKQFIITTDVDGSIINLIKKKSIDNSNFLFKREDSVQKITNDENHDKYLLIKIKGQGPLYLSGKTEISTLDKIKLQKNIIEEKSSYGDTPLLVNSQVNKKYMELQLKSKVLDVRIEQNINKSEVLQLREQQNKLLMFPGSSGPRLQKKQSLPLTTQCGILADDLQKLKQKINLYMKVLDGKELGAGLSDLSQIKVVRDKTDEQVDQKMKQISAIDFDGLISQGRWKQQKQQYIDYIRSLQKQLQGYRNHRFSFTVKDQQTNYNKNSIEGGASPKKKYNQEKAPKEPVSNAADLIVSQPASQSRNPNGGQGVNKYNIFKSQVAEAATNYYKNQYHVNDSKSRSKSKGSKVIYLRR